MFLLLRFVICWFCVADQKWKYPLVFTWVKLFVNNGISDEYVQSVTQVTDILSCALTSVSPTNSEYQSVIKMIMHIKTSLNLSMFKEKTIPSYLFPKVTTILQKKTHEKIHSFDCLKLILYKYKLAMI